MDGLRCVVQEDGSTDFVLYGDVVMSFGSLLSREIDLIMEIAKAAGSKYPPFDAACERHFKDRSYSWMWGSPFEPGGAPSSGTMTNGHGKRLAEVIYQPGGASPGYHAWVEGGVLRDLEGLYAVFPSLNAAVTAVRAHFPPGIV